MAYRIINLAKPVVLAPSSRASTPAISISQMIVNLHGKKGTITVPSGIYIENLTVPDGVTVLGNGIVHVNGQIELKGEGILSHIETNSVTVLSSGNRVLINCTTNLLSLHQDSHVDCRGGSVSQIRSTGGNFIVRNTSIGTTLPEYAIDISNSMGIIESCTIEGSTKLGISTVLDCKQTSIVGGEEDLFETFDETTTLQLFNCTVYGAGLIKSGPGTSIRANVIALSDAVGFEGGENIKIESI